MQRKARGLARDPDPLDRARAVDVALDPAHRVRDEVYLPVRVAAARLHRRSKLLVGQVLDEMLSRWVADVYHMVTAAEQLGLQPNHG